MEMNNKNRIEEIIVWVEKNIDIDNLVRIPMTEIKVSKIKKNKNVNLECLKTPLIVSKDNNLLDGNNRYELHLKTGNEYVDVVRLPNLGEKYVYLDLILREINNKLFKKRILNNLK
jgi:hypothetical protein